MPVLNKITPGLLMAVLVFGVIQESLAARFNTDIIDSGVVRITIRHASGREVTGSGILLNRRGYVLTNYHVIKSIIGAKNINYFVFDGDNKNIKRKKFQVLSYSRNRDIALIKVENIDQKRHPIIFADSESSTIFKGMRVWTVGFSAASEIAGEKKISLNPPMKDGTISIKRKMILVSKASATRMFEHTAAINGGNSGGPLLNTCGYVIGMNQSKASAAFSAHGTFWSIRSVELIEYLKQNDININYQVKPCQPSTVIVSGERHKNILVALNANRNRWRLFTIVLAGTLTLLLLGFILWWKFRTRTSHEGVSQFVRRELSRVLRHRSGNAFESRGHSVSSEPMTVVSSRHNITYGILVGRGIMKGKQFVIGSTPLLLGRGRETDCRIKDERVGRRHLKLGWDQDQCNFFIEDLGSVNGTWLSPEHKIESGNPYYLQAGVEFYIADQEIAFAIELPEAETVTNPVTDDLE